MPETFSPIIWHNDTTPAVNENNLNRIEVGLQSVDARNAALELGILTPIVVPYATSVTLNATQGALFRCTATGDLTLDDIVGGVDGQTVVFEVIASAATRVLAFTGLASSETITAGTKWTGSFRYDAGRSEWLLADIGGAGTDNSGIVAKGDLLIGVATGQVVRLPVGAAGQVLVVDPTTTTGLRWATPISVPAGLGLGPLGTSPLGS